MRSLREKKTFLAPKPVYTFTPPVHLIDKLSFYFRNFVHLEFKCVIARSTNLIWGYSLTNFRNNEFAQYMPTSIKGGANYVCTCLQPKTSKSESSDITKSVKPSKFRNYTLNFLLPASLIKKKITSATMEKYQCKYITSKQNDEIHFSGMHLLKFKAMQ